MDNAQVVGYLRLMRPPNLPTAAADVLAGAAIAGYISMPLDAIASLKPLLLLVLASVSLYAGGVVMNDVFDYQLDKKERPERPLPSGLIAVKNAAFFGVFWLALGVLSSFLVSALSGFIAILLCTTILLYDAIAKKYGFFGPLTMGLCRGLNLILGLSIAFEPELLWLGAVPIVYIFAITLISRGEVSGNNKSHILMSGMLYLLVIGTLSLLSYMEGVQILLQTLPFLLGFILAIFIPLQKAYVNNQPQFIKKAVMAGVLSVVLMDATLAAIFGLWWYALLIIALLPLSLGLAKLFAVT